MVNLKSRCMHKTVVRDRLSVHYCRNAGLLASQTLVLTCSVSLCCFSRLTWDTLPGLSRQTWHVHALCLNQPFNTAELRFAVCQRLHKSFCCPAFWSTFCDSCDDSWSSHHKGNISEEWKQIFTPWKFKDPSDDCAAEYQILGTYVAHNGFLQNHCSRSTWH